MVLSFNIHIKSVYCYHQGDNVISCICLSVCLYNNSKDYQWILTKNQEMLTMAQGTDDLILIIWISDWIQGFLNGFYHYTHKLDWRCCTLVEVCPLLVLLL